MPVKGKGKDRKEPRKPRNHTFGKGEGMNLREKALFLAAISRFIKHKKTREQPRGMRVGSTIGRKMMRSVIDVDRFAT